MQYSRSMIMVLIQTIFLRLHTRRVEGAGTDGNVYLGIGGREFYVDSEDEDYNDFESGDNRTYIFGALPSSVPPNSTLVAHKEFNDPRQPDPLDTMVHLVPVSGYQFPAYIRFEPGSGDHADWCLEEAAVRVNPVGITQEKLYFNLLEGPYLWLGQHMGKYLGLFIEEPKV